MLPKPEIIVSIHGVGEHEPEQVAQELLKGLGENTSIPIVDFNWCKTVEAYERDRIAELSSSISTSNSQGGPSSSLLRAPSDVAELLWGFLYLTVAMIPLLFAPTLYLYAMLPEFSLASSDVPGYLLRFIALVSMIALAATVILLFLCVAFLIVGRRSISLWLLRRSLLMVLRPVLALLFWLSSLDNLFKNIAIGGAALIGLNIAGFVFGQSIGWLFGTSWDLDHAFGIFKIASIFVAAALVAALVLGVLARAFSKPIKYARDVFNYIGSPLIRQSMQSALTDTAEKLPSNKNVVLACHSLGSVIAVDSLINSNAWKNLQSIVLITGGSPIHRWFQRFFAELFFPSDGHRLSEIVFRNAPVAAWINVFRKHDPVGASLDLPESGEIGEIETEKTDLKGFAAHSHYWSAPDVHDAIKKLWPTLTPGPAPELAVSYEPTTIPTSRVAAFLERSIGPAIVLTGLAAIGFGVSNYFVSVNAKLEANRHFVEQALEHGTRVTAKVAHRQYWRPDGGGEYGGGSYEVQKFTFNYATPEGVPRKPVEATEVLGNVVECCQLFDSVKLLEDSRPGDDLDDEYSFEIEVAYLEDATDKVAIPAYPPTVEKIPWYYDLVFLVLFAIFGVGLCGLLGLAVTTQLLALLVPRASENA